MLGGFFFCQLIWFCFVLVLSDVNPFPVIKSRACNEDFRIVVFSILIVYRIPSLLMFFSFCLCNMLLSTFDETKLFLCSKGRVFVLRNADFRIVFVDIVGLDAFSFSAFCSCPSPSCPIYGLTALFCDPNFLLSNSFASCKLFLKSNSINATRNCLFLTV